jgi:hypothetical protein
MKSTTWGEVEIGEVYYLAGFGLGIKMGPLDCLTIGRTPSEQQPIEDDDKVIVYDEINFEEYIVDRVNAINKTNEELFKQSLNKVYNV